MNCPPVRPLLGATAGLVLCFGSAGAATAPAAEEPAPAPATKPGWVSRVAGAPKKLAFWDKEKRPAATAPAPATAAPNAANAAATKPKKSAGTKPSSAPAATTKPTASKKRPGAVVPTAPAAPAPPEPAKKSFLSKLPALPPLPFIGKPAEAPVPAEPAVASAAAGTKKKGAAEARTVTPKPAAGPDRIAPSGPAAEEKKPGFFELGRLWPAGKKPGAAEAPATLADNKAKPATGKRTPAPAGQPNPKPVEAEAAQAAAGRPSLWSRMAAAVTPSSPGAAKTATTPVPKGLAPLGVGAPDSQTFVITKDDSAFYTYGPQQATPPDAYLPTGTVVTLTGKNWGWATVQLPDGRAGVVDRGALRPALISDLIPSQRPGDALMASLSPSKLKGKSSPNFILPAAEMPDLPTSGEAGAGGPGNPLLLPFSPDDISEPGALPPLPEIQPLPEPGVPTEAAPEPAAPSEAPASAPPAAPEPAAPAAPPEAPANEPAPLPE